MAKYLLSMHMVEGERPAGAQMDPEQMQRAHEAVNALNDEIKARGAWVFGGALHPASTATVVRAQHGEAMTTDGPFVETEQQIGGFYIIEAADLDAALEWAAKTSATIKMPIEVRPFREDAAE